MRAVGTENAWFSFNGLRNDDETLGVKMLSMPTRPHPARKGKLVDIPGAHGKLFQDEGVYDRILVSLRCIAPDNDNIDAVNAWLSGSGELIFGDEPNRAYHARITKEFSRSNRNPRLRGQEFTVTFDCEPFRYRAKDTEKDEDTVYIVETNEGTVISQKKNNETIPLIGIDNPGTVASAPMIIIDNTNNHAANLNLSIGRYSMTVNITGNTKMRIDCDAKIAFTGEDTAASPLVLATQHIFGDWIVIEPDFNTVLYTGDGIRGVNITIEPRWRWL